MPPTTAPAIMPIVGGLCPVVRMPAEGPGECVLVDVSAAVL